MKVYVVLCDSGVGIADVHVDMIFASEKDAEDYCFQKNFTSEWSYEYEEYEVKT